MDQARRQVTMGFTDEKFPVGTHMCLIYDNEDERRKVISKYLGALVNHLPVRNGGFSYRRVRCLTASG